MKQFSISFTGKTKRQVTEALATATAPETVKALIVASMADVPDDAIVNVSMSGYGGATGP